jgi:hypothetical protein
MEWRMGWLMPRGTEWMPVSTVALAVPCAHAIGEGIEVHAAADERLGPRLGRARVEQSWMRGEEVKVRVRVRARVSVGRRSLYLERTRVEQLSEEVHDRELLLLTCGAHSATPSVGTVGTDRNRTEGTDHRPPTRVSPLFVPQIRLRPLCEPWLLTVDHAEAELEGAVARVDRHLQCTQCHAVSGQWALRQQEGGSCVSR